MVVRSQGISVCVIAQKGGMIAVPFLTTLLHDVSPDAMLITISVCSVLAGLTGLLLPETKNMVTRETLQDMESSNSVTGVDNEGQSVNDFV